MRGKKIGNNGDALNILTSCAPEIFAKSSKIPCLQKLHTNSQSSGPANSAGRLSARYGLKYSMIKHIFQDVKWKYLLLSTVLLFCLLFLFGSLLASFKSEAFVFSLNNGIIKWGDQIGTSGNEFVNSPYWFPLHFFSAILAQFLSSLYLLKKSRGFEYTNGFALGIISAIFVYQLEVVSTLMGFVVLIFVAYKIKKTEEDEIKRNLP